MGKAASESKMFADVLDQTLAGWIAYQEERRRLHYSGIDAAQVFFNESSWVASTTTLGEAIDRLNSKDTRGQACKVLHWILQETFVEGNEIRRFSMDYYGLAGYPPRRKSRIMFYEPVKAGR